MSTTHHSQEEMVGRLQVLAQTAGVMVARETIKDLPALAQVATLYGAILGHVEAMAEVNGDTLEGRPREVFRDCVKGVRDETYAQSKERMRFDIVVQGG